MPYQRWEPFNDAELHEIRFGLKRSVDGNFMGARYESAEVAQRLSDEISHVQEQREMRRRRQELPA